MDKINDVVVVSATDLVAHLACPHVTWVDRLATDGRIDKPQKNDPMLELLQARGLDHESAYLAQLKALGASVVEIPDPAPTPGSRPPDRAVPLVQRDDQTRAAMADGVDVVYQATFLDASAQPWWRGHADFLRRVDGSSRLGAWAYEPEDTKLARTVKASAVLQLCFYAEQVERLQGTAPTDVHVILGGNERITVRLAEVAAYYRSVRDRFLDGLGATVEPYPLPCDHCSICRWAGRCHARWDGDDHLSRVAFMTGEQTRRLEAAGVPTLTALAGLADGRSVPGLTGSVIDRLHTQARLQHERRAGQPPPVEAVRPIEPDMGLAGLPVPDAGDLFYDIEGHPYVGPHGLEYLHGIGWEDDGRFVYEGWWAHTPIVERMVFEQIVDFIVERRRQHPNMHVYHYAPYETTAIGKLMGRYGTREDQVDDLLRAEVFVDLYRVVRQGLRIGTDSYSIKKLEPLYMAPREGDIGTGGSSIVAYEQWLHSSDEQILVEIEDYNRDDVESTWRLRAWLEEQRDQLIADGDDVPRRSPPRPTDVEVMDPELATLIARLTHDREQALIARAERERQATVDDATVDAAEPMDGVDPAVLAAPAAVDAATVAGLEDESARWLMADLLQWHRREAKPEWWQYFERVLRYEDDDFVTDPETIGGLVGEGEVGRVKRSTVWRYRFDPGQDFKLSVGQSVHDAARARAERHLTSGGSGGTGTVHALDAHSGTVDVRRGNGWKGPHPTALMPGGPHATGLLQESLQRVAEAVLDHGVGGVGPAMSARQLLARRPPRLWDGPADLAALQHDDEDALTATVRLVTTLDHSYLPVQGPPGAGKTYTAAHAVLALAGLQRSVGITAFTHSAIANLVRAVIDAAEAAGRTVAIAQKITEDDHGVDHPFVTTYKQPRDLVDEIESFDIVAGTAWLFGREDMADALDTLVVDEAGQLSLANVIAVAPAARNLVLVGDPQQLAQPSKGTHPDGAGVSALEHILDGEATVPPHLGVFLDQTWRMHPDVCAFVSEQVYDGRLHSRPETAGQSVAAGPVLGGAGLRWLPVAHERNRTSSLEEAQALGAIYHALVGRTWIDDSGTEATIGSDDILVVAPYNAQVHELAVHLPAGARIGTVDKFQGQEAAVVLVSMAASSAEDVSRGMEFLYSRNRLNVAVSRAKVLCVVAASPRLLAVQCHTVEQMRLANMLCRYVEMAEEIPGLRWQARVVDPRSDHISEGGLPAGDFAAWLRGMEEALQGEHDSDVPCHGCTACCTSSQFVLVEPDEADTLAHLPAELLFPAPRLPDGHVVMGYDEHGHCPMLVAGSCSIYEHRPRACRTYDCRVLPAAGLDLDDDEAKAAIAQRIRRWRFDHPAAVDRDRHDAVRAAAAFLSARRDELSDGSVPRAATPLAVAAVEIHDLFGLGDASSLAGSAEPSVVEVEARLRLRRPGP